MPFRSVHRLRRPLARLSSSLAPPHPLLSDLRHALDHNFDDRAVWTSYSALVSLAHRALPLEIHQQVLRRCAPTPDFLRQLVLNRPRQGAVRRLFHKYELRFQAVMRNMVALGEPPSLDDYELVLNHFAAYGHQSGVMQVFRELQNADLTPTANTIRLCLKAIAFHFKVPTHSSQRDKLISEAKENFQEVLDVMQANHIPFDCVILHLCLRIFKHTDAGLDTFETFLRWGFGIDLSNPDRVPLEYSDPEAVDAKGQPSKPFPFTTDVLNTIIDTLGRMGDVSKLVQAFEVLTQPLPLAQQHSFDSFDSHDEDDFGVGVKLPPPPFSLPSAPPNTTTYTMLLRHLASRNQHVLCRHYLLQAMRLELKFGFLLTRQIGARAFNVHKHGPPIEEIARPTFSFTKDMVLPVFGLANRTKRLELLRWLQDQVPKVLKSKARRHDLLMRQRAAYRSMEQSDASRQSDNQSQYFSEVLSGQRRRPAALEPTESSRGSESSMTPTALPFKTLDLDFQISHLRDEYADLAAINKRLSWVNCRTAQRVKERLGRRVWEEKDIYLVDKGRVNVSRDEWKEIVNFRENGWEAGLRRRRSQQDEDRDRNS